MPIIKVPACREHNEAFSKDDTYLGVVVVCMMGNNDIASRQFTTKILRAMERRPGVAAFLKDLRPIMMNGQETGAFRVDLGRFDRAIKKVTAGLYYDITGYRITDRTIMEVYSPDLRHSETLTAPFQAIAARVENSDGWTSLVSGHPRIFQCEYIISQEQPRKFVFRLRFYEGFRVWILSAPTDALWVTSTMPPVPTGRP